VEIPLRTPVDQVTRYLISFDDDAMTFPEEERGSDTPDRQEALNDAASD
jgi:hypothetical protein